MAVRIVIATRGPVNPVARIGLVLIALLLAGVVLLVCGAILLPLLGVAVALSGGILGGTIILALAGALTLVWRRAMMRLFSAKVARPNHPQPLALAQPENLLRRLPSAPARQKQEYSNQSGPKDKPEG